MSEVTASLNSTRKRVVGGSTFSRDSRKDRARQGRKGDTHEDEREYRRRQLRDVFHVFDKDGSGYFLTLS